MTKNLYKDDIPAHLTFSNSVAIDTETMGLNNFRDKLCVVQISSGNGDGHIIQLDRNSYDAPNLKKLLEDEKIVKIFHFARFDVAMIKYYLKVDVRSVYCTKIASKLVRTYTDAHGLKYLCEELLGKKLSKQQQSSDWGAEKLSKSQIDYAADDVIYLHKIKEKLDLMLAREGRTELAQKCFDFINIRAKLDIEGWSEVDIFAHK